MSTVTKEIADKVIANNGWYVPEDPRVSKVLTYNNRFDGGLEYAIVYPHENQMRYEQSPACHNVKVIWPVKLEEAAVRSPL